MKGTEPRGPSMGPASPVAAEGFDGVLCFGLFHLKIKKEEKWFISSLCFLQLRLFPPIFFPLFSGRGSRTTSFCGALSSPGLSPLCLGLLCSSFQSLTIMRCSPAARSCCSCESHSEGPAETQSSWQKGHCALPLPVTAQKPATFLLGCAGNILSRLGCWVGSLYVLAQTETRLYNYFQTFPSCFFTCITQKEIQDPTHMSQKPNL